MKPQTVFVGLGSNLGDRTAHLRDAVQHLRRVITIESASQLYVAAPPGYKPDDAFVNAVVKGTTTLKPLDLLHALRDIEHALGRRRGVTFGPRPIDLDILFYGSSQIEAPDLIIPHPRIAERAFVLKPLVEIAPNFVHPVLYYSMRELLQDVDDASQVKIYQPGASGPAVPTASN